MANLKPIIEESFEQYAGAVLQSRALVDVRDCLKPSARQIFYSMLEHKLIHSKPYKKTTNAVGMAMADYYIHGDSSAEGIIMHAGQKFNMNHPLIEVKGNAGDLIESGDWAASRYTESRLSELSDILFKDIDKETIVEWRDNYDNTKQFPSVLPSKGYYNIVNPTMGIGIGAACSIPGFNLKEVNDALVKLLWNSDIDFEDIYCAPDFPTGATILNESEVKEALRNGQGHSCKVRATINYNNKENVLEVTEIPFGVYTNTICRELENIEISDENPGIERHNDLTGQSPLIKIYLKKQANTSKVLKYLYKNTSLQSYYGINMTMLDNGRFPRVFTWKEALQAHLNHEVEVYTRGFKFDLKKIEDRIHIIDGLLICLADIDEVVKLIKGSTSTAAAQKALQSKYLLDEVQAKAVLDMKLSRLAHLEIQKLKDEKAALNVEAQRIQNILNDETLLKTEIENGFKEVSKKFGSARRTVILNIEGEEEEAVEKKAVQISLTNQNNLLISETSTLYAQKRGGAGTKIKLGKGEYVISTTSGSTIDLLLLFSSKGNSYHTPISKLPIDEKVPVESIIKIQDNEHVCALATTSKTLTKKNIVFFTKKGMLKKSKLSEYNTARTGGVKAMTLDANDEICSVLIMDDERVGMMTKLGQLIIVETKSIASVGRVAKGRIGMKINDGDELMAAHIIPSDTKELVSISSDGFIKRTNISEFGLTSLNTKGIKIQKFKSSTDTMIDFLPITNQSNILVVSSKAQIKIPLNEIQLLGRGTIGTKSMKIGENSKIVGISIN